MGASNFYCKNASNIFPVFMSYEDTVLDEDGEETSETETVYPDEWQIKDELDYFKEQLVNDKYRCIDLDEWDGQRSYPSQSIKQWSICKAFAGVDVEVMITAKVTSGYHEGACLDWKIEGYLGGHDTNGDFDITDFTHYCDYNTGVAAFTYPKTIKWFEATKDAMIAEMEEIFARLSGVKLKVVARFSNGETMYETVKD